MIIQDSKTIREIQQEFHEKFPGLKIEFYRTSHKEHTGSSPDNQYEPEHKLGDIRKRHAEGDLTIDPMMTITDLEDQFEELFGLHVQVFRRSRTLWLQTIATDDWTLEKQNAKGMHSLTASPE